MTGAPGGGGDGDDGTVGYGRPPQRSRFKKGKSGNPKGRPRKAAQVPAWARLETEEAIRAIGERRIKGFHKDGRPFSMKGRVANTRALQMKALQGDGPTQRYINDLNLKIERERVKAHERMLTTAYELKLRAERSLQRWLIQGRDELDLLLHPRDIEIDEPTGEVRVFMYFTQEQRDARDELRNALAECEAVILTRFALANEDFDDDLIRLQRDVAREGIKQINGRLPARFRRTPMAEDDPLRWTLKREELSEDTRSAAQRWTDRMYPVFREVLGLTAPGKNSGALPRR